MNIPPNQQAAGGLPMGHMAQQNNPQMNQGQQRIPQQGQQQGQQPQQMAQQAQQQMQQVQQQQQQPQQQQKTDEDLHTIVPKLYAKVKSLMGPLRETLLNLVTIAAQCIQQNSQLDVGSVKTSDLPDTTKFNKTMEEFYSLCDQIEYYLKTLIEIRGLSSGSERYMPLPVVTLRNEKTIGQKPALSYSQFLMTVRNQVSYAKAAHEALVSVAHSMAVDEPGNLSTGQ